MYSWTIGFAVGRALYGDAELSWGKSPRSDSIRGIRQKGARRRGQCVRHGHSGRCGQSGIDLTHRQVSRSAAKSSETKQQASLISFMMCVSSIMFHWRYETVSLRWLVSSFPPTSILGPHAQSAQTCRGIKLR